MNHAHKADWDPTSDGIQRDQFAAYDEMREQCPVAYSKNMGWSIFRHEDVVRVLHDHETFSNAVSTHLAVPNGMDPPEHGRYRRIIEPYFGPEPMAAFEPKCREIAAGMTQSLLHGNEVEFVAEFAQPFALQSQCAFLGWPQDMYEPLRAWTQRNYQATLVQDREAMRQLAREFEGYIGKLLLSRRVPGEPPPNDVTAALMRETVCGRPLNDEELVSILRNWTVGEIGTISAAIGILAHFLAQDLDLQDRLRGDPALLPGAIDEMLRIHGPLVANRRITTCPVKIGGRRIDAGQRISLNWLSANRDGRVIKDPEAIKLDRNPKHNLLYGAGIHVCPGAPLANLELRVVMEELLGQTNCIKPESTKTPAKATYPASGFSALHLRLL